MGKKMHKFHWKHDNWTSCGRYVSSNEGSMDIRASDVDAEVTCLACSSRMRKIYEKAGAEEQDKQVTEDE